MSKNRRHNRWGTHSGAASTNGRRRPQNCPCCCERECTCASEPRRPTLQELRAHDPVYSPGYGSLHPCEIEDIESGATVRGRAWGGVVMVVLKPCPFCGSHEAREYEVYTNGPVSIACDECGASTAMSWPGKVERVWNTRPPLASEDELRVLQDCASETYDEARAHAEEHRRWSNSCLPGSSPPVFAHVRAALAASAQRDAAILSALERRLRGVE